MTTVNYSTIVGAYAENTENNRLTDFESLYYARDIEENAPSWQDYCDDNDYERAYIDAYDCYREWFGKAETEAAEKYAEMCRNEVIAHYAIIQ